MDGGIVLVKKALHTIGRVLTSLILIFSIFIMIFTVLSVTMVNKENATLFGYKPYIVLSDSMNTEFQVGDMAVSKQVDPSTLKPGDIITYRSIDPANYGEMVTHKIREETTYEGKPAFITFGTTTGVDDTYPALQENIFGKYVFHLPKMGYFFQFLKSTAGYITLILIPFLVLIILQSIKFVRLFRQYKREQMEEVDTQKAEAQAQLEEARKEREKTEAMLAEMERLKARLEDQDPPDKPQDGANQ
nr:signal peptidase I [uncultured Solibaculum sp.]